MIKNIAIIGSSGGIGSAFTRQLAEQNPDATIHAYSRNEINDTVGQINFVQMNYQNELSIETAAKVGSKAIPFDLVIVATGLLHDGEIKPEKSLRDLSAQNLMRLYEANTILPAIIAKHFLPKLNRNHRSIFAVLSARVGSISDNNLGGWYGYRASKSALNMIIKNAAIEIGRKNKEAIIVGLHPGTVDSGLSKPFQGNVPEGKLFTPAYSVGKMLAVIENLTPQNSGKCYAWDGLEIKP